MENNQMEALKFNLKRQNEQGNALVKTIERVEQIESNMNEKYEKTEVALGNMEDMLQEVNNRVTLEDEDARQIKSIVSKKASAIAKQKYPDIKEFGAEYRELIGYARRTVYKRLKQYFNVTKYTSIRHVDREKAKEYADSIKLDDSFLLDYEQWRQQKIKKEQREKAMLEENENK